MKKIHFFTVAVAIVMVLFVGAWAQSSTMGVTRVPVGARACSNEVTFYANAMIDSLVFNLGTALINNGTFVIDNLIVRCGSLPPITIPWDGVGNLTITACNGLPYSRLIIGFTFCGKCTAGYWEYNQQVNMCNKSYNPNMTVYY